MGLGQLFGWIGAFVGGVIGFFIGGPLLGLTAIKGAFLGATVGFAIGGMFAPMTPDVKSPDQPSDELQLPSNVIGNVISDGLGTVKVVGGQLLFYGKSRAEPQYKETIVKGKNNNVITLIGYKYYLSWGIGILAGPVDTFYTILRDDQEVVWEGELNRPASGGHETIVIEGMGPVGINFGTGDQGSYDHVAEIIGDPTLNTPYRGLCWVFFDDNCIGNYNRMPTLSFVVRKTPVFAFSDKHVIQTLDYNPMHAVWYILAYLSKLPESWLHSGDFVTVASTLRSESRGISALFSSQQSALNLLESINGHIGNIFRYGSDGKFHPKLIRDDYDPDDPLFPVVDESIVLDKPEFNRKSWIDTLNEVKVQYSEITGRPEVWSPRGCIGWYKVDEGSGLILYNSAPVGVNKLPDLDIVVPNANFWSGVPGFGYWDISPIVTQVYSTWAARFPFPTRAGTIIIFAKEDRGIPEDLLANVYYHHDDLGSCQFKQHPVVDLTMHISNLDHIYLNEIDYSPRIYKKNFIHVFTHDEGTAQISKAKYAGDSSWKTDTKVMDVGFNSSPSLGIYIGCDYLHLGIANLTFKGIIGDLIICNVLLTDEEIDEIVTKLGTRWGF